MALFVSSLGLCSRLVASLTFAGVVMYVLPGPGLPVLLLGLVTAAAGGLLVAAG